MKLNIERMKDISDDIDFCFKLAKEESVIILPGMNIYSINLHFPLKNCTRRKVSKLFSSHYAGLAVGLKNWIRITFAVEPSALEEAMERLKSFCERHSY